MKIKLLSLLCLFQASVVSYATPGDDIWIHIAQLAKGLSTANTRIDNLSHSQSLLEKTTQNLQEQINNIPEGKKGERGLPGEQGIQGQKGEKGERGEQGLQGVPGKYIAGEGISIEGSIIKAERSTRKIGDLYHGGIIFWLDETGDHGLVVSKTDINKGQGIQWRNGASGNKVTNARADGIGAGEMNTNIIISQQTIDQQSGSYAALLAVKYRIQEDGETPCTSPKILHAACYGSWYLPSAYELALIRKNISQQGFMSFAPDFYWSSTEDSATTAWMQNFATGELMANKKDSTLGQVRAVSRF